MSLLYAVETSIPGNCAKRIGLPGPSLQKAKAAARDASILHGNAAVYGLPDLYTVAIFENGTELSEDQW